MAVAIMISTFGCINSLVLSGARAYYAMARDKLFSPAASRLNRAGVPGASLVMQAVWAGLLLMVNTYSPGLGYGNIYSDLLDYIISAALLFYILTIAGLMVLRRKRTDVERPYRTFGYPAVPPLYSGRDRHRALSFPLPPRHYLARADDCPDGYPSVLAVQSQAWIPFSHRDGQRRGTTRSGVVPLMRVTSSLRHLPCA